MPIYEFRCADCGHRFEQLCRIGEDGGGLTCPECDGHELKRCQSTFAARSAGSSGANAGASGKGFVPT